MSLLKTKPPQGRKAASLITTTDGADGRKPVNTITHPEGTKVYFPRGLGPKIVGEYPKYVEVGDSSKLCRSAEEEADFKAEATGKPKAEKPKLEAEAKK